MKKFKNSILKYLCMLNRLALIVFSAFGIDVVASKYNFPWQIVFIIVLALFVFDYSNTHKQAKRELQDKIHSFLDNNPSLHLTPEQIMEMQSWYK